MPLRELLLADLDLPVLVENDANAAVLAERRIAGGPESRGPPARLPPSRCRRLTRPMDGRSPSTVADEPFR